MTDHAWRVTSTEKKPDGWWATISVRGDTETEAIDNLYNLVDIEAVAHRLGVKRETVRMWRHREILPEPEWYLNGGPIWRWETIEAWAKETGRLMKQLPAGTRYWLRAAWCPDGVEVEVDEPQQ